MLNIYLRHPDDLRVELMMRGVLEMSHWAKPSRKTSVTKEAVSALQHMDEDPAVIDHLLLGLFNSNLVGAALEIFDNMDR